jgi:hypothetical protein
MTQSLPGGLYGQDTSATDTVKYGRLSSGVRLVGEAIYRRFISTRGTLRSDLNYGLNIIEWLQSNDPTLGNVLSLQSEMRSEALKDERLDDATVTVIQSTAGAGKSLTIEIDCVLSAGPTFTMTILVSQVTAELLGISEAA